MISLTSGVADLILQRTLSENTFSLNNAIQRMSSGYKINAAKDNAAGFSIKTDLNTRIRSLIQIQQNSENGISLLTTAEGNLSEIRGLLNRLRELSIQAANGTYNADSINAMQSEADEIVAQITAIRNRCEYDGLTLFENKYAKTEETTPENPTTYAVQRLAKSAQVKNVTNTTTENNSTTTYIQGSAPVSKSGAEPLSFVSEETEGGISTFSLARSTTIEETLEFASKEVKVINIDGVEYTVTNQDSYAKIFNYSKDTATGVVTFSSTNFKIVGQSDVVHNIVLAGTGKQTLYTGDKDDTVVARSTGSSVVYCGAGNDTLIAENYATLHGEDGDDIITSSSSSNNYINILGGAGNDTININRAGTITGGDGDDTFNITVNATVIGDAGNDTFNLKTGSNGCNLNGGADDDVFNLEVDVKNVTINGSDGTNTVVGTGTFTNSTLLNVDKANATGFELKVGETITTTINNIEYTFQNGASNAQNILYEVKDDGTIEFRGFNSVTITGQSDKAHKIKMLNGNYNNIYGGELADTIYNVHGSIHGLGGDDILSNKNAYCTIYGDDGNDIISANNSLGTVYGGAGNDTFIGKTADRIYAGDGDDTIELTATTNSEHITLINAGDGNDTLSISEVLDKVYINAGEGNDEIINDRENIKKYGISETADNIECITLSAKEKTNITINGINYAIENKNDAEQDLFYSYNPITEQITFTSHSISITGQKDKQHNVLIHGNRINFTGGDLDDKLYMGYGSTYCNLYGGAGNDYIEALYGGGAALNGGDGDDTLVNGILNGGNGDDTLINNAAGTSMSGGDGNDTYIVDKKCTVTDSGGDNIYHVNVDNVVINGSSGNETYYVNSNSNTINGNSGDDYFIINGESNTIDGGTDNDLYIDNTTTSTNTIKNANNDPNAGALAFSYNGEVKTFELNGKSYTITNKGGTNTLAYSLNPNTNVLSFEGSDFLIESANNQDNNINIKGDNNIYEGSNYADIITIESGSNNAINTNAGADTINLNSEENATNAGAGNDTINLNATTSLLVEGGSENDTINIKTENNTNVSGGSGNNVINIEKSGNKVVAENGNNIIYVKSDSNNVNVGNGNNQIKVTASNNTIVAGNGNNTFGIQGDSNTVTAQKAVGDFIVVGSNNDMTINESTSNISIRGNSNSLDSDTGSKDINIIGNTNNITTGNGSDSFVINGDNNIIASTSGSNEVTIKGDSNQYNGGNQYDNVKIYGSNNTALGGESNDKFVISRGSNNYVDGNGGKRNTIIDNATNTTSLNVIDVSAKPFELNLKVDIGSGEDKYIYTEISFNLYDLYIDFSTEESTLETIQILDDLINKVDNQLLRIGANINRIHMVAEEQAIKLENLISFRSTIQDADMAKESADFIRYQILQDASATLMASSRNIRAESVLGLLQGLRR